MRVIKRIVIMFLVLLFILGLTISLYPYFQGQAVDRELKEEAQSFLTEYEYNPLPDTIVSVPAAPEVQDRPAIVVPEIPREHAELWDAMQKYNLTLWEEKQSGLSDPWAYEQPSFTLGEYGLEAEIFGVISIPVLDLEMPLYLGATYENMAAGATHLSQTSLPIGGENTNCVIAGHRGWKGASYFRYITELTEGDEVIITNLWETLTYQVTGIQIIDPNDVEKILIQEGRDMVTLLTCHPYASGGRQRYLVFCDRINQ